jgi:hypothetical protein
MKIPPGYEVVKRANVLMAVRREHRDALVAVLTGPDAGVPEAGMTGRVAHSVVTIGGSGGIRAVRKRYVRGGVFGGLLGGCYVGRGRAR